MYFRPSCYAHSITDTTPRFRRYSVATSLLGNDKRKKKTPAWPAHHPLLTLCLAPAHSSSSSEYQHAFLIFHTHQNSPAMSQGGDGGGEEAASGTADGAHSFADEGGSSSLMDLIRQRQGTSGSTQILDLSYAHLEVFPTEIEFLRDVLEKYVISQCSLFINLNITETIWAWTALLEAVFQESVRVGEHCCLQIMYL